MQWRFARKGLQVCEALVAAFWKVGGNRGLACGLVPHSSAASVSVWAARLLEKFLSFLPFYSLPGWEVWRGVRDLAIVLTRAVPSDKCCSFYLFLFCLPGRLKKKQKTPTHFLLSSTPCSFTRKKEAHRARFIHKVSIQLSLLVFGSGFSCFPQSKDQRGRWGSEWRTVKRPALPECNGKPQYFWMSGMSTAVTLFSIPPFGWEPAYLRAGQAHPPFLPGDVISLKGATLGGKLGSWSGFHGTAIPYLRRRQVSHRSSCSGRRFWDYPWFLFLPSYFQSTSISRQLHIQNSFSLCISQYLCW